MSDKELWELMSIICEGQDSEQRRKVEQYITDLQKEIEKLQSKNKKIQTILRTRARQDRKRKAKLRKLRLETTNQRLKLERLHSIIKEVREYLDIDESIRKTCKRYDVNGIAILEILEGSDK